MARVAISPTVLSESSSANSGTVSAVADPAGTATVAGSGNGVQLAAVGPNKVSFRVTNSSGGTGTLSVLAGSQPLAIASGLGPVTFSIPTATTVWIGPFETARVLQNDGSLILETSVAMTVSAFQIDGKHS